MSAIKKAQKMMKEKQTSNSESVAMEKMAITLLAVAEELHRTADVGKEILSQLETLRQDLKESRLGRLFNLL